MKINKKIKELRVKRGYSQEVLGNYLGVSKQAISMYERGERGVDSVDVVRLADIFNVTTDELLGRENPNSPKLSEKQSLLLELFDEVPEDEQEKVINLIKVALGKYDL